MNMFAAPRWLLIALTYLAIAWTGTALADPSAADPALRAELHAASDAALAAALPGPRDVKLLDQATLHIEPDQSFVPAGPAERLMRALGNGAEKSTYGMVFSRAPSARWMILVRWIDEGYVRDGDAKDWKAHVLLQNLRDATEAGNPERLRRGLPALDITGWVEPPAYDSRTHRLVWSLAGQARGTPAGQPQLINYNTYALGRDGYFSLDLITNSETVATDKLVVRRMLGSLVYNSGKRYEDFDQTTDKVAAYGLAALIGAVAVKKLGLLALTGVFFLKIWKLAALAAVGTWAAIRRFLGRGRIDPGKPQNSR